MPHPPSTGRILLSLSAAGTTLGAWLADFFSVTHIFNPRWPPHAKFHGGQTISMSVALLLLALYLIWRRYPQASLREQKQDLWEAFLVVSLYWVTQATAGLFPGALPMDPEFGDANPQKYLQVGFLAINAVGYWVEGRRIGGGGREKDA